MLVAMVTRVSALTSTKSCRTYDPPILTLTAIPETIVFLSGALVFIAAAWRIKRPR